MKKVAALLLALLAATALVACGSSSDDSSSTPAETTGSSGGGETAKVSNSVTIEAVEGTDLAYTSDTATSSAGEVAVEFSNPQAIGHDVRIEDSSGKEVGGTEVVSDGKAVGDVELKPGKYTFFCSIPGHREAGMEGTLTVK